MKLNGFILLTVWMEASAKEGIKEVTKVIDIFFNHLSGVINALVTNFNNAMAERLNGKIQEIKVAGRGYITFNNFRRQYYFFMEDYLCIH